MIAEPSDKNARKRFYRINNTVHFTLLPFKFKGSCSVCVKLNASFTPIGVVNVAYCLCEVNEAHVRLLSTSRIRNPFFFMTCLSFGNRNEHLLYNISDII